jgi:hypothetical protein
MGFHNGAIACAGNGRVEAFVPEQGVSRRRLRFQPAAAHVLLPPAKRL